MSSKINKFIKLDLHIHSDSSSYKESNYEGTNVKITANSNIDNLDTLYQRLEEKEISLFSITDHNRFNSKLYLKIKEDLKNRDFQSIKNIIPGIEINIKFDEKKFKDKKPGQMNIYFDAKKEDDFVKIEEQVNKVHFKNNKEDYYTKEELEELLRKIGLNVIIIASQTKSFHFEGNSKKGNNALSDHCDNPLEYLWTGYISAIELKTDKAESLIIRDLKEVDVDPSIINFSDCHDWEYYPKHNKYKEKVNNFYTEAKIQPNFKGLLFAVTSPKTRIYRTENKSNNLIEKIIINDQEIFLDPSINVIIGDNGVGKSFLALNLTEAYDEVEKDYKKIIKNNVVKIFPINKRTIIMKQNEITNKLSSNKELFDIKHNININSFKEQVKKYFNNLKEKINNQILCEDLHWKIKDFNLKIEMESKNKYPYLLDNIEKENENKYKNIIMSLSQIKKEVNNILSNENLNRKDETLKEYNKIIEFINSEFVYYSEKTKYIEKISNIKNELSRLILNKNIYYSDYQTKNSKNYTNYLIEKSKLVSNINNLIKQIKDIKKVCDFPFSNDAIEIKKDKGFIFKWEANYNNIDTKNIAFKCVFNKEFQDEDTLLKVNSEDIFKKAIKFCDDSIENSLEKNLNNFFKQVTQVSFSIQENNDTNKLGKTPGELSLAYLKYSFLNIDNTDTIWIFDQPEDNISNNRIIDQLIKVLNQSRDTRQIFIVTHNPLLVANLDVDNVLLIKAENNKISVINGSLDFEDEKTNILKLVIDTMEGGDKALSKRMEIYKYEKSNNS